MERTRNGTAREEEAASEKHRKKKRADANSDEIKTQNLEKKFCLQKKKKKLASSLPQTLVAGGTKLLTIAATSFPCFSAASPAATWPVTVYRRL